MREIILQLHLQSKDTFYLDRMFPLGDIFNSKMYIVFYSNISIPECVTKSMCMWQMATFLHSPPPSSNGMSFKGRLSVPCGQVIQISGSTVEFGRTGADQVCTLSPVHQVPKQHY